MNRLANHCRSVRTGIARESFESLAAYWSGGRHNLRWPSVFVLPYWLQAWWQSFGPRGELLLLSGWRDDRLIGIAPLYAGDGTASFVGGPDVCDYLDVIVSPGSAGDFMALLLDYLDRRGIGRLELHSLRPDSAALMGLAALNGERAPRFFGCPEAVSQELALPADWGAYLALLSKKQRHEIRRKVRRLEEAGDFGYRVIEGKEPVARFLPHFFSMFKSNPAKAGFMTGTMELFFRSAAESMSGLGLMKIGVLELGGRPAAAVLYFDYNGGVYLYNSGYDPAYASLSAGYLCKVLSIKDAVERGKRSYDFLKGAEPYKQRLGGREIPVYACRVEL